MLYKQNLILFKKIKLKNINIKRFIIQKEEKERNMPIKDKKDYKYLYDSLIYTLNAFLKKYDFNNFDEIYSFMDKYKINKKMDKDMNYGHEYSKVTIYSNKKEKKQVLSEFDKIIIHYYKNNELKNNIKFFPEMIKNIQINDNIKEVNKSIQQKYISDATIIYNFYKIYYKFLNNNKNNLSFENFIEYNKDNYKMVDRKEYRIKNKIRKCYTLLNDVCRECINKKHIINFLSKFNITYIKIYKIKEEDLLKLKEFFKNELKLKNYKEHDINVLDNNNLMSVNESILINVSKDIPISYPGSKKKN